MIFNSNIKNGEASSPKAESSRPFDLDNHLNRFIPYPRLYILLRAVSHFLGYRPHPETLHKHEPPNLLTFYIGCFIGTFGGLAMIEGVYRNIPNLDGHQAPIIIGSFGAAAILEYNAIGSPFSQPRSLILGHVISALIGICITKLFALLPPPRFQDLRWLAGALSVAISSVIMHITKTIHPPAGATAILIATSSEITPLGWWVIPLVLLGCVLMLASACLVNNLVGLRFPLYWWTNVDLLALHQQNKDQGDKVKEVDVESTPSTSTEREKSGSLDSNSQPEITITRDKIIFSTPFTLTDEEEEMIIHLQERLSGSTTRSLP